MQKVEGQASSPADRDPHRKLSATIARRDSEPEASIALLLTPVDERDPRKRLKLDPSVVPSRSPVAADGRSSPPPSRPDQPRSVSVPPADAALKTSCVSSRPAPIPLPRRPSLTKAPPPQAPPDLRAEPVRSRASHWSPPPPPSRSSHWSPPPPPRDRDHEPDAPHLHPHPQRAPYPPRTAYQTASPPQSPRRGAGPADADRDRRTRRPSAHSGSSPDPHGMGPSADMSLSARAGGGPLWKRISF
ncbi:hypothetical protein B0H15DRAFT_33529 [Mycena belliarum]|uniref:Uncharacterized protein n=1 Tax=Mycena belliarum TaxID=1033014 RepID=A0AAD6XSW5_9AGAR|nr:hypothetical protein B0H15DRAFT_33529 [Mycena belliae]